MPAAAYELGLTLDPLIDAVIAELKTQGWNVAKGVRYGIPYIRIKRTGFFYTIEYDSLGWIPFGEKLPEVFMPRVRKYWAWSALLDKENPNTTGHLFYNDLEYWLKPRGAIRGLGSRFSHNDLLLCIYILLWDPCVVQNSFTHLNTDKQPSEICPVCSPPKDFSKKIPDGIIPRDYLDLFSDRTSAEHQETIHILFSENPENVELDEPIELFGLKDRFETEREARDKLANKALSSGKQSKIPEHFLYRHLSDVPGIRSRTWLVLPQTKVAHLGRDTNLGSLPDKSIPAIKTNCDLIWLDLPNVLDGDFGRHKPCVQCVEVSAQEPNKSGDGRRLTDMSWTEDSGHKFPSTSRFFSLGWGQPILTPENTNDKTSWYRSAISEFGLFTLMLTPYLNRALKLQNDESDKTLVQELIENSHPGYFECLLCKKEQAIGDLCEEFATPASSSKYKFLISLSSVVRIGPSILCSSCRSLTYGFDYPDLAKSETALEALVKYHKYTGLIPDRDWRRRPILRDIPTGLTARELSSELFEAVSISLKMPSGFRSYPFNEGKTLLWEEDPANWWELLYKAGLVGKFKKTARGNQGISDDGHLCLSMLEWKFCNFLYAHDIVHIKEPRYSKFNQTRADYLVGELFIEIAGLLGDKDYEKKLISKLENARFSQQRVLVLSARDIDYLTRSNRFTEEDLESLWLSSVRSGGYSSLAFT